MKKRLTVLVISLVICIGYGSTALAQVKPEILVKQRQAVMTLFGKYFGPIAGMADGKTPLSMETVGRNAGYLETLSKMPWDGFVASTSGEKSRALPVVYSDPGKFKKASDDIQAAVLKLVAVSKGTDDASTKGAIGAVGKACGSCHEVFRQPS